MEEINAPEVQTENSQPPTVGIEEGFGSLGLPTTLLKSLELMEFRTPTPIQAQTIPLALAGRDVLGSAQTGTGKTGAYGIPLVAHLLKNPQASALVLAPTRELALQVYDAIKLMLGRKSTISSTLLIGGAPMFPQLRQLKQSHGQPGLIVGTPGRINDHLERGSLVLDRTDFVVFDETDRMLDMGFLVQLKDILNDLPEKRQMLMFSATMAPEIVKIANNYLKDPVRVSVGSTHLPIEKIQQDIVRTSEGEKYDILLDELEKIKGSFIVFVKTKFGTERLAVKLRGHGHDAEAIHGDLRQSSRLRVIQAFRDGRNRILVATDVAARGLDVSHIECVVNYDMPQCPEDYIHRIGRTGRAGAAGRAVSLVTPQDNEKWFRISKMMNPKSKDAAPSKAGSGSKTPSKNGGRSFRDDRPRGDRSERPAGDGARGFKASFSNDRRPARDDRSSRDDRPSRTDRPERTDRSLGDSKRSFKSALSSERPARDERPTARAERPFRDERPTARAERPFRDERPARDDRPARDSYAPKSTTDRPKKFSSSKGSASYKDASAYNKDAPPKRGAPRPASRPGPKRGSPHASKDRG